MMKTPYPTTAQLRELFDYRPEGLLVWKTSRSGVTAGESAGHLRNNARRRFIKLDGRQYLAYRLIWLWHGYELPSQLDHKDNNSTNDRIENLRPATAVENAQNTSKPVSNTSGAKGVSWNKRRQKWWVQLKVKGKQYFFGSYDDFELAELVAEEARAKYHGAFART